MSDNGIETICTTIVVIILILAYFTSFFDNIGRRK